MAAKCAKIEGCTTPLDPDRGVSSTAAPVAGFLPFQDRRSASVRVIPGQFRLRTSL